MAKVITMGEIMLRLSTPTTRSLFRLMNLTYATAEEKLT